MRIQFSPVDGMENSLSVLNIVECFMFMAGEIFTIYVECDQQWRPQSGWTCPLLGIIPYLTFNATVKWCTNKVFGKSALTLVKP